MTTQSDTINSYLKKKKNIPGSSFIWKIHLRRKFKQQNQDIPPHSTTPNLNFLLILTRSLYHFVSLQYPSALPGQYENITKGPYSYCPDCIHGKSLRVEEVREGGGGKGAGHEINMFSFGLLFLLALYLYTLVQAYLNVISKKFLF